MVPIFTKRLFLSFKGYIYNFLYKSNVKTLFLIDILYMKDINAIYRFNNGDYIIAQLKSLLKKKIIKLIKKKLRKKCLIHTNNLHADVFAITVYENLTQDEILTVKDLIFKKIINHNFLLKNKQNSINLDVTIGCSKSRDNMIRIYAEKALYNAKLNGIHYAYYDSKLYDSENINESILEILNYNISNNLVEPFFQPIIDTKTEEVEKYEALMRIYDKEGNILSPFVYIHKAKKARLYTKLMEILITKVVEYIKEYKINVSINLDYTDILNPYFKKSLLAKINTNKIGKYLTIEILEGERISNYDMVNDFIKALRKYDVKIAIDDFGTGFSNYEYILSLDIDYIKIDGSLIKKIDEDIYLNLVKSIVLFSKQQDIKIVAEFVSDLKILRYVNAIGIDYAQGFYLGKPQSIETIFGEINEKRT